MAKDYPESRDGAKTSAPQPDAGAAAEFLESIAGGLPMTVAGMVPDDRGGPSGATFTLPEDRSALCSWITEREGRQNLYYSLNAAAGDTPRVGKAGRLREADVTHIRGVAVDLDPQPGECLDAERARLFVAASKADANPFGSPTTIVDSGGGVQMLWLFPEALRNDPATAAAVKAQTRGLEAVYGSDAVHSLDHLFRLPFTTNMPDARKRARGRSASVATTWAQSGDRHDLPSLRHLAPPVAAPEKSANGALCIEYADVLDALGAPEHLPDKLRAAAEECTERFGEIVGTDADDRSKEDYRIAAHLIRKHRITDPTELACATFAVSPAKLEESEEKGRGEHYCGITIAAALKRSGAHPSFFFDSATDEELATVDRHIAGRLAPSPRAPKLRFLDLDAIERMPQPRYLINRHIPEGVLGFLYGKPGSFKSFFALDWAMTVACGLDEWQGEKVNAPAGARVIYLAAEGATGMRSRIKAWMNRRAPFGLPKKNFFLVPDTVNFFDDQALSELVDNAQGGTEDPVALIVVDTVSRSIPGADENLQKDMTTFVAACGKLQARFGCAVLGVHHAGKDGRLRGSTVIEAAGDFIFKVARPDAVGAIAEPRVNLFCDKMKDDDDKWGEDYHLDSVGLGWTKDDGSDATSLVPRRAPKVEHTPGQTKEAAAWGAVALSVLGARESALWSDVREPIGKEVRAQGLAAADSEQHLTGLAKEHLSGLGAEVVAPDGQIVSVRMTQAKAKGRWTLSQFKAPGEVLKEDATVSRASE